MLKALFPALCLALPLAAQAGTTLIDTGTLPTKQVYDVADLTPLAVSAEGAPAVILLDLAAGDVVPPHAAKTDLRLLTVLKGDLYWGDGSAVDEGAETVYPPGSILALPSGVDHWIAARTGDVRLQLIVLDDERTVPAIEEQLK